MARSRLGNIGASSLLKSAQASYDRAQTYNDQIAGYEWELSDKSGDAWNSYQSYLKGRLDKTTDPTKQLSLEKTLTTANRAFNSAEIQRATLSVNYGDISKTDKYNKLFGLYQGAIQNGDQELAGNIESQMASLSVQIQNEAIASARGASAAAASGYAAVKTQLNDLSNKIDIAYQTGQPLKVGDKEVMLNATDYAINRAQILRSQHDLLSAQAQQDPKYADDLSNLEKSPEYRGLIQSGMVQFDQNNNPIPSDSLKNLAVSFKKDQFGNVVRDFTAVPTTADGKQQYGLVQPEPGSGRQMFVANRQLNNTNTDPSSVARVAYDLHNLQQNGKDVPGVSQYQDLLSGNTVLTQTEGDNKGLRATAYNGKSEKRTVDQAAQDLQSLANAKQYKPGELDPLFDNINNAITPISKEIATAGRVIGKFDISKELGNLTHPNAASAGNLLSGLFNKNAVAQHQAQMAEAQRQAEAAQSSALQASYARQQAIATQSAQRTATPAPLRQYVPYAPKAQVYLPTPVGQTPANVFNAAKAAGKSTAAAIGNAVGYNF